MVVRALVAGALLVASADASDGSARFARLSVDDGLAQNSVETILQDRFGFLWFGTQEGLNRYDGYDFVVHRARAEPGFLVNSSISALAEDARGDLWVGTAAGLQRLELETGRFHSIMVPSLPRPAIVDVVADGAGKVWFTARNGGLFVVEPGETRRDEARQVATDHLPSGASIDALATGKGPGVWVASDGVLLRVDLVEGQARATVEAAQLEAVSALAVDPAWGVWIGRPGGELLLYDPEGSRVDRFPAVPRNVLALLPTRGGTLWIGASHGGLSLLDPDTGTVVRYSHDPADPSTLSEDDVAALYADRFGSLWIGTWNGGVSRLDPYGQAFRTLRHDARLPHSIPDNDVLSMVGTPDGRLWLGSRNGVLAVGDPQTDHFEIVPLGRPAATRLTALDLSGATVILGTSRGLITLDSRTSQEVPLSRAMLLARLDERTIDAIEARSGTLWIASGKTLFRQTPGSAIERFDLPVRGIVRALFAPSGDRLWIGTQSGEVLIGKRSGADERWGFVRVGDSKMVGTLLEGGLINALLEDAEGRLWLGTQGGLGRLETGGGTLEWLDREDGLPSLNISCLLAEPDGALWFGTNRGLTRLTPGTNEMSHFGSVEGAQGTGYADRACASGASGVFYFAGRGLTAFDPDQVLFNPHPPEVVFTRLEVLRQEVTPRWRDPDSPLERAIHASDTITLGPDASVFSVEFAGLEYSDPESNRYRYRLDGFDADWIETGAERRVATYTRLAPGEYVLRVRAGAKTGTWSPREASLTIHVLPPWWQSRPAMAGWAAFTVLLGVGLWSEVRGRTQVRIAMAEREALRRASFTDPLTGLSNRRFLDGYLQHEIPRVLRAHEDEPAGGTGADLLFVLVDIDRFKSINDRYSHAMGDRVLKGVADVLASGIRGSDLAVRWGGDEFLIVSRFVDHRQASATVERLRQAVERLETSPTAGEGPTATVSIGYALFPFLEREPGALSWERTLDLADRALILTKNRQRNSYTGLVAGSDVSLGALDAFLDGGADAALPQGVEVVTHEATPREPTSD